jgi:hypothetical protein
MIRIIERTRTQVRENHQKGGIMDDKKQITELAMTCIASAIAAPSDEPHYDDETFKWYLTNPVTGQTVWGRTASSCRSNMRQEIWQIRQHIARNQDNAIALAIDILTAAIGK